MEVIIIVGVGNFINDKGFPIGKNGSMPWKNKADLKWFKDNTTGHPVIMGRKTYEAIGHPLKNRTNIVVSSRKNITGVEVFDTLEKAIEFAKEIDNEKAFIIGGGKLYNYALEHNLVDKVLIDLIDEDVKDSDTFFPDIVSSPEWIQEGTSTTVEKGIAYAFTYVPVTGKNNHVDEQYLNLVNEIIEHGEPKDTRAGKTRSLFGKQLRFNLKEGLPILTTKKVYTKGVIHELLWFLKGDTNIKYLVDNDVHIWDDDAYRYYLELMKEQNIEKKAYSKEIFLKMVKLGSFSETFNNRDGSKYYYGDLGPIYGRQWTDWDGYNGYHKTTEYHIKGINQIKELIEKLKTNPDDRRLIVSAWNVGELKYMALPPCHYTMQFYTKKMTLDERIKWAEEHHINTNIAENIELLDEWNVPTRKLSCMWNQRSVDSLLGLPYNCLSYSLLTYMIAQCCNMDVDELIFNGGDVHVYENQIEIYKEQQMNNNPHRYALPKLELNPEIKDINEFTYDDIKIEGYKSYPPIKYPLSVGL